jgi:hypothetical protein
VPEQPGDVVEQDSLAAEEDARAQDGIGHPGLGEQALHERLAPEVGIGGVEGGIVDADVHDPLHAGTVGRREEDT